MTHYDRTKITFHRGNAFTAEGIDAEPFATFTIDDLVDPSSASLKTPLSTAPPWTSRPRLKQPVRSAVILFS
jgi:hypothetical protein